MLPVVAVVVVVALHCAAAGSSGQEEQSAPKLFKLSTASSTHNNGTPHASRKHTLLRIAVFRTRCKGNEER
jgi:hypothetical protein